MAENDNSQNPEMPTFKAPDDAPDFAVAGQEKSEVGEPTRDLSNEATASLNASGDFAEHTLVEHMPPPFAQEGPAQADLSQPPAPQAQSFQAQQPPADFNASQQNFGEPQQASVGAPYPAPDMPGAPSQPAQPFQPPAAPYGQSPYGGNVYNHALAQTVPSMSFGQAVKTCLQKYVDSHGRARRSEYWWFILAAMGLQVVLAILMFIFLGVAGSQNMQYDPYSSQYAPTGNGGAAGGVALIFLVLYIVVALGTILPIIMATIRRLHDQNQSGMMALLYLVPYVGGIIMLILCVQAGTVGPNQYGPDPKAVPTQDSYPQQPPAPQQFPGQEFPNQPQV